MRQPQIQEPTVTLGGTEWRLLHFQARDDGTGKLVPPSVENYTLAFEADGSLAMQLDCNRGMGKWEAQPTTATTGTLSIPGVATTRAMCQPGAIDTRLAADMAKARTYVVFSGKLKLVLDADGGSYVWERMPTGGG